MISRAVRHLLSAVVLATAVSAFGYEDNLVSVSGDETVRRIELGAETVYVFTNTVSTITVTPKVAATLRRALIVGGGGAGGANCGGGGSGASGGHYAGTDGLGAGGGGYRGAVGSSPGGRGGCGTVIIELETVTQGLMVIFR